MLGLDLIPFPFQDIPSLTAEAAKEHPGVSYVITAPLGLHELLVVSSCYASVALLSHQLFFSFRYGIQQILKPNVIPTPWFEVLAKSISQLRYILVLPSE